MPPIPHPPGAPIEAFQPKSDPTNQRMAMILLAVVGVVVLCGTLYIELRLKPKAHQHTYPDRTAESIASKPHTHPHRPDSPPK